MPFSEGLGTQEEVAAAKLASQNRKQKKQRRRRSRQRRKSERLERLQQLERACVESVDAEDCENARAVANVEPDGLALVEAGKSEKCEVQAEQGETLEEEWQGGGGPEAVAEEDLEGNLASSSSMDVGDRTTTTTTASEWVRVENVLGSCDYLWDKATNETKWSDEASNESEDGLVLEKIFVGDADSEQSVTPVNQAWQKVLNEKGEEYWWNTRTDETRWALPPPVMDAPEREFVTEKKDIKQEDSMPKKSPVAAPSQVPQGKAARHRRGFFGGSAGGEVKAREKTKKSRKPAKGKLNEETVQSLEISSPFDVEHKLHVRFDEKNVRFSGLPVDWDMSGQKQFGVELLHCPRIEVEGYRDRIPAVLVLLRQALGNLNGFTTEGVFRLAPAGSENNAVKEKINQGLGFEALSECSDPHVPANLIKQFFRQLQPNLLNCMPREKLVRMAECAEERDRLAANVEDMEEPYRSVLQWLLDLMCDVAEHQEVNKMTAKNLAIVVSPNLFDVADSTPMDALFLSQKLAILLEQLVLMREYERRNAMPIDAVASPSSETTEAEDDDEDVL